MYLPPPSPRLDETLPHYKTTLGSSKETQLKNDNFRFLHKTKRKEQGACPRRTSARFWRKTSSRRSPREAGLAHFSCSGGREEATGEKNGSIRADLVRLYIKRGLGWRWRLYKIARLLYLSAQWASDFRRHLSAQKDFAHQTAILNKLYPSILNKLYPSLSAPAPAPVQPSYPTATEYRCRKTSHPRIGVQLISRTGNIVHVATLLAINSSSAKDAETKRLLRQDPTLNN